MTEEIKIETQEERNKKENNLLRIGASFFGFIVIVSLFLIKYNYEDFSWGWVIGIGIFLFIILGLAWFGSGIMKKLKVLENNNSNIPEPYDQEYCYKICKDYILDNLFDNLFDEEKKAIPHSAGKTNKMIVWEFIVPSMFSKKEYNIFINAHYPKKAIAVLKEINEYTRNKTIQNMSFDPEDPADTEERTIENPLLGTREYTKRISYNKEKEKDKSEKGDVK